MLFSFLMETAMHEKIMLMSFLMETAIHDDREARRRRIFFCDSCTLDPGNRRGGTPPNLAKLISFLKVLKLISFREFC